MNLHVWRAIEDIREGSANIFHLQNIEAAVDLFRLFLGAVVNLRKLGCDKTRLIAETRIGLPAARSSSQTLRQCTNRVLGCGVHPASRVHP